MRLNHVALTVADRDRSAAFYGEHFGLTRRVHDDDHLLILADDAGSLLALSRGEAPHGLPRTNHFGFQVDDPAEVHELRERLRAAGVEETAWQDDGAFVRVQVSDPDGYRVEAFATPMPGRARPPRSRWTSFTAGTEKARARILSEEGNPAHRVRVEHNRDTLLVHLSDEEGEGWTVLAVDRATRRFAVVQALRQLDAAEEAFGRLYPGER